MKEARNNRRITLRYRHDAMTRASRRPGHSHQETKNRFERRVAAHPRGARQAAHRATASRCASSARPTAPSSDHEFEAVGCVMVDDATDCRFIMGVKEVKTSQVRPGQTVMCFSHTIKGQSHNMPLLQHFLDQGASLMDYEVIVDDAGRAAGGLRSLRGPRGRPRDPLDPRAPDGRPRPRRPSRLSSTRWTTTTSRTMADHTREASRPAAEGPEALSPLVVAVTGNGRVSQGRAGVPGDGGRHPMHRRRGHHAPVRVARRPHAARAAPHRRHDLRARGRKQF
jgi:hypothetical protein